MLDRTVNLFLISASLNRRASVYCIDGDSIVGDDRCGHFYEVLQRGPATWHIAHTRPDIVQFVHDLYEIYQQRKKSTGGDTILFIIKNLQFLDLVQTMLQGDRVNEAEYIEATTASAQIQISPKDPLADLMDSISVGPTNSLEKASKAPEQSADDPFAALLAQVPSLTADTSSLQSTSSVQSDPFADLMSSIPDFGGGTSASTTSDALGNASDKLQKLIADGAAYGIHFIVCSSDYQTVKESMHFGSNVLNKFRERIVFALSDSDAFNLIDNVNVSTLHTNTVYYTNGTTSTFQFKPYVSPEIEQMKAFFEQVNSDNEGGDGV